MRSVRLRTPDALSPAADASTEVRISHPEEMGAAGAAPEAERGAEGAPGPRQRRRRRGGCARRLTRKLQGKTVTLVLSAAHAEAFRQVIANHRQLGCFAKCAN